MPLVKWYTQPLPAPPEQPKNFSSYYLYDTDTHKLVRIRLELDRGSGGETRIGYNADRAVGFGGPNYTSPSKGGKWTVNDKFELSYKGTKLAGPPPAEGLSNYDVTVKMSPTGAKFSGFHPGNKTTNDPKLPPGVKEDHLMLLAQDAMITPPDTYIVLTQSNASIPELTQAIQDRVAHVLGKESFSEVTDELITGKLRAQGKTISGEASEDSEEVVEEALVSAEKVEGVIVKSLSDGSIVPDEPLEAAVEGLVKATSGSEASIKSGDVAKTMDQLKSAEQEVAAAVQQSGSVKDPTVSSELDSVEQSLVAAKQGADEVQQVEVQSENQDSAKTSQEYVDSVG